MGAMIAIARITFHLGLLYSFHLIEIDVQSEVRSSELEEVDDNLPFENLHDLDVPDEVDDDFELGDNF